VAEHYLIGLALIIVLGIGAQWLAWRTHLPAILLLLVLGILAGPVFEVLHPDELFGEALMPLVSISVAIILFEGGLSLRLREIRTVHRIIWSLISIGIIVTWLLAAASAYLLLDMTGASALLLGAVLVVSGPTVIIPLLRQVRPTGNIGSIVKWEGIINDPVGAILAVLVFEVILQGTEGGVSVVALVIVKSVVVGGAIGIASAVFVVLLLRRHQVPDFLQNPASLMLVVICYAASNAVQTESGLLAVTVMGLALANQRYVSIKHITEFKENLRVILISSLFIILAARLPIGDNFLLGMSGWVFVLVLILVVRPAAVFASTVKSQLRLREKLFLAWVAPRGIVAAAVSSVFAIRLLDTGHATPQLVPVTFQVIIGTVAIYGVTAPWAAQRLRVAKPDPQGVLFVGAHVWARQLAESLAQDGFDVKMIDSNWANVSAARNSGLHAVYGNILSEDLQYNLQLDGIGRLIALTPNDEVNSLAVLHFADIFGRSQVYQLAPEKARAGDKEDSVPLDLSGRRLFGEGMTYNELTSRFRQGAVIKKNTITDEFNIDTLQSRYGAKALPLFLITEARELRVVTDEGSPAPRSGEKLLSLVEPIKENAGERKQSQASEDA
jgi:NhaP-type Na+/H+ or K+/H+ antiporter